MWKIWVSMGVLKWKDPWQRDFTEINELYDTGFCNRVFHWEIASYINDVLYDNKFKIAVESSQWPETKELVTLPNTIVVSNEDEYFNKLNDIHILDKTLVDVLLGNYKLNLDSNYISKFSYIDMGILETKKYIKEIKRPLSEIKLKNKKLEKDIQSQVSDLVGIHLRRSRGVKIPQYMYESDEYSDYIKFRKEQGAIEFSIFDYVENEVYFNVIDSILEMNKNQKFYLSHDIPSEFVYEFKERYNDVIFTKDDIKSNLDLSFINDSYQMHVDNMIDLFSLSNTKYLLSYPVSTWSVFAYEYDSKKRNFITDELPMILSNYERIQN
jgi:hypothetical protein